MSFERTLKMFADWREQSRPSITTATVEVTERYARRVLRMAASEPLVFRGLTLNCIGSRKWRAQHSRPFTSSGNS